MTESYEYYVLSVEHYSPFHKTLLARTDTFSVIYEQHE